MLLTGSLQPGKRGAFANSAASMLFVPVERKFPMIRVQTRQVSEASGCRGSHAGFALLHCQIYHLNVVNRLRQSS